VNDWLSRIAVWLNAPADALGSVALAPIGVLPGWLSATLVASLTGIVLLAVFKHTSNQASIKRVRDDINANLLALKLFKESASVALKAQGRIIVGAGKLFVLAIVPMLVMVVPVTLALAQIGAWYQFRPLRVGEDAVLTLALARNASAAWPAIELEPTGAIDVALGPVRIESEREACWKLVAKTPGYHTLHLVVDGQRIEKQIAIGDGYMQTSPLRPGWDWSEIVLFPLENPFTENSVVRSIKIDFPSREGWVTGSDYWIAYWFIVSMIAAFAFRKTLNVHV
jgi:hypothetical protein